MARIIFIIALATMLTKAYSQQMHIIVYSGDVSIDNNENLPYRQNIPIPAHASRLHLSAGSQAIVVTQDHRKAALSPSGDTSFSFTDIAGKLSHAASVLVHFIFDFHDSVEKEPKTVGATNAAVKLLDKYQKHRESGPDPVSPADSVTCLSGQIALRWQPADAAEDARLIVYAIASNDTICNKRVPESGEANIVLKQPGAYLWQVYSPLSQKREINRTIILPGTVRMKQIAGDLAAFRKETEGFDEALRNLLLEDYYELNNISE